VKFVDEAIIEVLAGDGGNGAVACVSASSSLSR